MSRLQRIVLASIPVTLAAGLLLAAAAAPDAAEASFGPPWIAVEVPPNGIDETTRGALALVITYHHATPLNFPVTATAEGLVRGERVSRALEVTRTSRTGVHAVRGDLPDEGRWVLRVDMTDSETGARASALIAMAPGNEEVATIRVPRSRIGNWPRPANDRDMSAMLKRAEAVAAAY